ncbi:hypothetical protein [Cloacibacillus evryensis]|uniref:hypothetical protein n=1 Tax=Cloacibacillus evryensis TaxID=508460 RepID=UPI00210C98E5|nr:hypothetical protein [Cloacibacillus evryensis]MCQ4765785.1 hypothetical protein [Cloacibacillus evryensis]
MASLSRKIEFYWLNVKPDAIREKFEEIKELPLDLKEEKNSFFPVSAEEIYLSMRFPAGCSSPVTVTVSPLTNAAGDAAFPV